jgi:hypothetical protein
MGEGNNITALVSARTRARKGRVLECGSKDGRGVCQSRP